MVRGAKSRSSNRRTLNKMRDKNEINNGRGPRRREVGRLRNNLTEGKKYICE